MGMGTRELFWHGLQIEKAQSRESVCAFDLYINASEIGRGKWDMLVRLFRPLNDELREMRVLGA